MATCPFCGKVCEKYKYIGTTWGWEIACMNPGCKIQPRALFKTQKDALIAWNIKIDVDESSEVKQCPFCGAPGCLRRFLGWNEKYGLTWVVACINPLCKIHPMTQLCQTPENAIENWNTRSA